eukprot:TRINITY_DN1381_c0_g1_i1.p1 TRINITY_DN1381_c0_g1~~TRINITY_DN1381_c0_g1_i1.p1  ORF type:complete len:191 (+),score=17.55 TRINITY_DN1381_c0_g1_i1:136-708(+)
MTLVGLGFLGLLWKTLLLLEKKTSPFLPSTKELPGYSLVVSANSQNENSLVIGPCGPLPNLVFNHHVPEDGHRHQNDTETLRHLYSASQDQIEELKRANKMLEANQTLLENKLQAESRLRMEAENQIQYLLKFQSNNQHRNELIDRQEWQHDLSTDETKENSEVIDYEKVQEPLTETRVSPSLLIYGNES